MTWFGNVSAWAALGMAALFAVNAYFQFATGVSAWVFLGVTLLLGLGGIRTLRKMSGGLRLLAGAWGLAAGVLLLPYMTMRLNETSYVAQSPLAVAFVLIALAGLALTVLHK